MAKLKTYNEFVNEALIDAVKNPIKWKKIKNNAKKYQKAKVAQALNDVDFAKRKEKSRGKLTPQQDAVLTQAQKAKNAALKDTATNIAQRMTDLATTTGLKRVAQLAKTKSAMAANQIVLKAADGEEAKRLKVRQKELNKKATEDQKALADYEADTSDKDTGGDDKAKEQISALRDQRKPLIDSSSAEKDPAKRAAIRVKIEEINVKIADLEGEGQVEAKEDLASAKEKLTKATGGGKKLSAAEEKKAEQKQKLGDQIGKAMQAIEKAKQERVLAQTEEDKLSKKLSDAKGTDAETALARSVADADKAGKDIEKAIKDLQKNVKDLQQQQKDLNESINEGMYTADQLTNMLLDDIRKGIRKGIQAPDEKELKTLALKRLKMKRVMKRDIEDTINGWENSLADARKDKIREYMFSDVKATKGKIPESFEYVAESVSQKFARLRSNL